MRQYLVILTLFMSINLFAQHPPQDWYHQDAKTSEYHSISVVKTYQELLKGKASQPVIVAVIDSGVDAEHEDLKDNMWVNHDEIPDNGIDDDKNGYIDDIHGWNFIGGANGQNVSADTYEVTRLYAALKYKYDNAVVDKLSKKQKKEYEKYLKYKSEVEEKREKAQSRLSEIETTEGQVMGALSAVSEKLADMPLSMENVDSINADGDTKVSMGVMIMKRILAEETPENMDAVLEMVRGSFADGKERYQNQLDYAYNPEFNPRSIVGDDYKNVKEKSYGNNDVEGPDALHGTHVAGIIGAVMNNDIGMDGVADNVKIMSIRAVPDGDERDKDVANSIIYAVDNGASIINMSFGKGYSSHKAAVEKAIKYALKKDVLLVHAAGNSAQDNDTAENYPNDEIKKRRFLFRPKKIKAKNWLEVGALSHKTAENSVASFSNYGQSNVDIFAPGQEIYSTLPDDKYRYLQGTSMASPVVAGVAAVLRSYFPSLTAIQVKEIIMESSTKSSLMVNKPGSKDEKVPFSTLSASGGMINLYDAVELAQKTKGKKKIKRSAKTAMP